MQSRGKAGPGSGRLASNQFDIMADARKPRAERAARTPPHLPPVDRLDRRRTPLLNPDRLALIADWFREAEQAAEAGNVFDAFFKLWMSFNGWASAVSLEERDSAIIDAAAKDLDLRAAFNQLRAEDAEFEETLLRFVREWPVYSETKAYKKYYALHHRYPPDLDALRAFCEDDPDSARNPTRHREGIIDWENTLRVVYQVRCNFVHGGKGPSLHRDRVLVECSYRVLHRIIVFARLLW